MYLKKIEINGFHLQQAHGVETTENFFWETQHLFIRFFRTMQEDKRVAGQKLTHSTQ